MGQLLTEELVRATLTFIIKDGEILLSRKKKKIGQGLLNGQGGRINPGERAVDAAAREANEEIGVTIRPQDLEKVAVVTYHNQPKDGVVGAWQVHIFLTNYFSGMPHESEEMESPEWYPIRNLPFNDMLPADQFILPRIFNGEIFEGEVWYGPEMKRLLKEPTIIPRSIEELDRL